MNKLTSPLLNRQRMPIGIRFTLRHGQKSGETPRQLYIKLRVNGAICSDYTTGVFVRPDKWNSGQQKVIGSSKLAQETNRELEDIIADHKRLFAELQRLHQAGILPHPPTAEAIRYHWTKKIGLIPTVMAAYSTYLNYLQSLDGTPDAREKRTLDKWRNGQTYLAEYLKITKSERLTVDLVTTVWAQGFYHYLIKKPLGLATAARFVGYLRASFNHMVVLQKVSANPIVSYFPDKGKDKPIYFLEQEHLDRLWSIPCTSETHRLVRDWLLLMCYTGLDQPDLERYLANPSAYEEYTEAGTLIVIERGKTELTACIPLLPEVEQITANYPGGVPTLSNQAINRWTVIIQEQIGFEHRLTTKICRKTAGALFLRMGLQITEVSKVLGHSSIQTTLRNYVQVTNAMVKAGMLRIQGKANSSSFPFSQVSVTHQSLNVQKGGVSR